MRTCWQLFRLGNLACVALLLGCTVPQQAQSRLETLVGTYVTEARTLRLTCASDTHCTMRLYSAKDTSKVLESHEFKSIVKLQNMVSVNDSLKYTRDQLAKSPSRSDADLIAARRSLALLREVNLGPDDCHDLRSREGNEYLVVCRVQASPWHRSTLLFFGTQLSRCNDLYCGYMILPMFLEAQTSLGKT